MEPQSEPLPPQQEQPEEKSISLPTFSSKQQPLTTNYGSASYWEERYRQTKGQRFDWLLGFDSCFTIIENILNKDKSSSILNIGCGNGQIQDELYEAGYHHIVNNDISRACIEQMEQIRISKQYTEMVYHQMDVQDMSEYTDEQFDLVLDKSTIDALMCSDDPVLSVSRMLEEIHRVLKPNKWYMIVSYSENRLECLKGKKAAHVNFEVSMQEMKSSEKKSENETENLKVQQTAVHYLYLCKKMKMEKKMSKEEKEEFYKEMKLIQDIEYPPKKV